MKHASILAACFAMAMALDNDARCAPVSESEAVAIAEWWYAAEINADTTPLSSVEKQTRTAGRSHHALSYVLGPDNYQRGRRASDAVTAYLVAFEPDGFVVVSGEDTLQPVLVFNATGSFGWGDPKTNYLSYFVGRCVAEAVDRERALPGARSPHANWTHFRSLMKNGVAKPTRAATPQSSKSSTNEVIAPGGKAGGKEGTTYVLLPTALWDQGDHYNEECVSHNGGSGVPTGCVATSMAIKFRYHQWPWSGNSSHSYTDNDGSINYSHTVDFGSEYYDWGSMPTNSLTADNTEVAELMYACGVAVNMDYETGGSGAWSFGEDPAPAINNYFRYRGTYVINSRTTSDHTNGMSFCIQSGVPVIVGTDTHAFVACGYRDTVAPYFYFNMGWSGGNNGWYDVNDIVPNKHLPLNGSLPYSIPNNHAYADPNGTIFGNGNLQSPYFSVPVGQSGVPSGGTLWLRGGDFRGSANRNITLSKPMTVKSYLGETTVGRP